MTSNVRGTFQYLQQENIRLQEENEHFRDEVVRLRLVLRTLGKLSQVSTSINKQTDIMKMLDQIMASALICIGADDGTLMLADEDTKELAFVVAHGQIGDKLTQYRIPLGEGIAGWVAEHAQPQIIPNVYLDDRFSPQIDQTFQFKTHSMLCVPIVYNDKVLGVIQVLNKSNRKEFNQSDLVMLTIVSQLAASSLARAETLLSA